MTTRTSAIAIATFREAVRDKLLLLVVVFAVGMVLFSRVLGWLSVEDELKMVQDFSLSGMSVLALFLAMLVGAGSLAREVERRTVYTVLTRTATRTEFILGKFVGLVWVFWLCLLGAGSVLALWVLTWGGHVGEALIAAMIGLLLETVVLTAVALFLGALSAPAIASVGTFAFYLVGHGTEALRELTEQGKNPDFAAAFALLYRILPNLENVNFINATTSGRPVDWPSLGFGAIYVLCWTAALLAGAVVMFRRRQF
jgi:ABC-type transport system involved in multi-copper enzyme maturation permease subunit